jgi:hypothetical protein
MNTLGEPTVRSDWNLNVVLITPQVKQKNKIKRKTLKGLISRSEKFIKSEVS